MVRNLVVTSSISDTNVDYLYITIYYTSVFTCLFGCVNPVGVYASPTVKSKGSVIQWL